MFINLEGKSFFLNVFKYMTIRKLKEEYFKANNIPFDNFYIFQHDGIILKDEKTIEYYEIEDDDIIISTGQALGG